MTVKIIKAFLLTVPIITLVPYMAYASTAVGIDSFDTYETEASAPVETGTARPSAEGEKSNGPVVISEDDGYYPGAEIDVTTDDNAGANDFVPEEEAEKLPDTSLPVTDEVKQTGIPSLDQYTDVSEEENTRLRITDDSEESYNKRFEAYISSGTIRLEAFYTAGVDSPEIVFTSSGGNRYSMTEGTKTLGRTMFRVKNGYSVSDFPDIRYSIIYISNAEDPGKWDINISLNNNIKEFALLTTEIPAGWETLDTDYKTQPKELLLWYLAESGVDITKPSTHSIEDMIQIIRKDTKIPTTNDISSTEVRKEVKESNPLSGFFLILIITVIIGVLSVILILKKIREQSRGLIRNRITFANHRHRMNARNAEETIDRIMTEDMSAYFSNTHAAPEERKEQKPCPVPMPAMKPVVPAMADGPVVYRPVPDHSAGDEDFF